MMPKNLDLDKDTNVLQKKLLPVVSPSFRVVNEQQVSTHAFEIRYEITLQGFRHLKTV